MSIMDKVKRGRRFARRVAPNSSTGMTFASSLLAQRGKIASGFLAIALLVCLGAFFSGANAVGLSHEDAVRIGRRVWQNECGGTLSGLTSWNAGEDFASLGIGHFIWYPSGRRGPFEESFPELLAYLKKRGVQLPEMLRSPDEVDCPWNSRAEFLAAHSGPQMQELRKFLAQTIGFQADFLVARLHAALPKMLAAAPASERKEISRQFQRLAASAQGCYALIDYVNFKGDGTRASERYRGRGWGLLQVLEGMLPANDSSAPNSLAASAARVLRERVASSPPQRHEERWLRGWLNRVSTYRQP